MRSNDLNIARCERRVGTTLGARWRLARLLGVGGMAAVYEAVENDGKRTAVKLLHESYAGNPTVRARFQREAYIANRIGHPGVVRIIDDGIAETGQPFLVMELLQGQSVDLLLADHGGRLGVRDTIRIGHAVLAVLEKAHALGIVHRDLKPENLFLTKAGVVKVLDFGIARLLERSLDSGHTRTGIVMGTPAFMAPEQALGRWSHVDARTDLWALGSILYLLLSGRLVHGTVAGTEMLLRAATQSAPSLARCPEVPKPLVRVVDRALAYDPKRRFPDARTMRLELVKVLEELGERAISERPPPFERDDAYDAETVSSPAELAELAALAASEPVPSSPRVPPPEVDADSIVDARFAHSLVASYLAELPRGQAETVTSQLRAALRKMAVRAPDAALKMLGALCQELQQAAPPADAPKLLHAFASAIVSTRALRFLLTSTDKPGVDASGMIAALRPLLGALGAEHAGVALDVLPSLAEGELKEIVLDYAARSSRGYEAELGGLFDHAPAELGVTLVRVLARIDTPAARESLLEARDSEHAEVVAEAERVIRARASAPRHPPPSAPAHAAPVAPARPAASSPSNPRPSPPPLPVRPLKSDKGKP